MQTLALCCSTLTMHVMLRGSNRHVFPLLNHADFMDMSFHLLNNVEHMRMWQQLAVELWPFQFLPARQVTHVSLRVRHMQRQSQEAQGITLFVLQMSFIFFRGVRLAASLAASFSHEPGGLPGKVPGALVIFKPADWEVDAGGSGSGPGLRLSSFVGRLGVGGGMGEAVGDGDLETILEFNTKQKDSPPQFTDKRFP